MPWPQKGPSVDVGLSGNAPIAGFEDARFSVSGSSAFSSSLSQPGIRAIWDDGTHERNLATVRGDRNFSSYAFLGAAEDTGGEGSNMTDFFLTGLRGDFTSDDFSLDPNSPSSNGFLYADLSGVNAITINDLRQAFQIQKLLERDARGGTRYTEILRSHFGVISPDARLQRPEYLGGSRSRINIVPVQQTSNTTDVSPQGNLAAYGLASDVRKGFNKSFVEHGYIIGLVNIRADLTYQQGLNRMWSRRSRFDFYWPSLAHLGEQAILNKEIYVQGTEADNRVFGYQERYAEYRYYPSMITGKLRSTDPQSLDVWHLAQKFDSLPTLSSQFIEENPPIKRALAVQNEPEFFLDVWFDCKCARPMPVYGVPGLVDHF